MTVWHKRGELPHGFIEENKLFVYVFDDGVDVTEYCEQYHKCSNLKKWCVFNELCGLEERLKRTQDLELDVRRKLDIAIKALESYANDELWSDTSEELFFFDGCFCSNGYQLAQDALKQIGEKK